MGVPAQPPFPATFADFKAEYARHFRFGDGTDTVTEADVTRAMRKATTVFNPRLFNQSAGWLAFMLVTAHFVRTDVVAAGGLAAEPEGLGVENQAEQVRTGAGAAGVTESFAEPPDFVKQVPLLLQLWVTTYGQQYVAMVQPKTVGPIRTILGPQDFGAVGTPDVPWAG